MHAMTESRAESTEESGEEDRQELANLVRARTYHGVGLSPLLIANETSARCNNGQNRPDMLADSRWPHHVPKERSTESLRRRRTRERGGIQKDKGTNKP